MLIPTTKETPNDATVPSHIYLIRGGFIQSVGSGLYNFLPLGKIVLDRIRAVVKEELDMAQAQEVDIAFVTPASLWEESGRLNRYGRELLRFRDRKDNEFVLGPTHEEMVVTLVKQSIKSYKQLPINLYQIKTKFRDEIRPRFGLMRGREFLMKDGYSFHKDEEDMVREFYNMERAYSKIFTRLGVDFRVVEADGGAIGGALSREFMVLADSGEDTLIVCKECRYGANVEAAKREPTPMPKYEEGEAPEMSKAKFYTPNVKTIDALSKFFHIHKWHLIKAVVKKAIYDDREQIAIFFIRGTDELQETKALNSVGANELIEISDEELSRVGIVTGSIGPFGLPEIENLTVVIDLELKGATDMIAGANEKDYHLIGVDLPDVEEIYSDIITVKEGDRCPKCGAELRETKGIEVGHIFQLGTKYSEPLSATFLDESGKSRAYFMGTYGIGISRLLSAIIEQNHDDRGCIWTEESRPFDVHIVVSNIKSDDERIFSMELYENLKREGFRVLIDDRKERFGFKIKDYELIGITFGVIVGKKLKDDKVELIVRDGLKRVECTKESIIDEIKKRI
jgi:prolyl-tRNA synthetase